MIKRTGKALLYVIIFSLFFILITSQSVDNLVANEKESVPNDRTTMASKHLSYDEIVSRMYDLEALADIPEVGERSDQFSSTDPASRASPGGEYVDWAANRDWDGHVRRTDRDGWVIADMEGPGYITRIWAADPSPDSILSFYFDGETRPSFEVSFRELFTNLFGYDQLSYTAASGFNFYIPIAYNESLRIEAHGFGPGYHLIEYTTLPEHYTVEQFQYPLTAGNKSVLQKAQDYFVNEIGNNPSANDNEKVIRQNVDIKAGDELEVFSESKEMAITSIRVRVNELNKRGEDFQALRELTISGYWDGSDQASIWAPLGDYFGSGTGLNSIETLPVGMQEDGWMYSYWYMPFEEGRIVIGNDGDKTRNLDIEMTTAPLSVSADELLRFNTKWSLMEDRAKSDERWPDSQVLYTEGTGRFVGTMMHIYKENSLWDDQAGPGYWWWGEGDEKFFIDGEVSPSWFGTGTEDYFGYAWGDPTPFSKAYHAQPENNKGGMYAEGNRTNLRFQVMDNIPFQESFDGYFEKYYRDEYVRQATLNYWYLDKDSVNEYDPVSLEERTDYYRYYPIAQDRYEIEDVYLKSYDGEIEIQRMNEHTGDAFYERKHQLKWGGLEPGDELKFYIVAEESGYYDLTIGLNAHIDYGMAQFYVNDQRIGDRIDAYSTDYQPLEEYLGTIKLNQGENIVKVVLVDRHVDSHGFNLGLDYLTVERSEATVPSGVYELIDWQPDGFGTWEPTFDDQDYNNPHIVRDAGNSEDFIPSGRFTEEDFPAGTIIEVIENEFLFVLMHWAEGGREAHEGDVPWVFGPAGQFILTEDWWEGKSHVAFNTAKLGQNLVESGLFDDVVAAINVWIPAQAEPDLPEEPNEPEQPNLPIDNEELQALLDKIATLQERIRELEDNTDVADLEDIVQRLEAELIILHEQMNDLESENTQLKKQMADLQAEIAKLREIVESRDDEKENEAEAGTNDDVDELDKKNDSGALESEDDRLPNTSTQIYNLLLIGGILLVIGFVVMIIHQKRKRKYS